MNFYFSMGTEKYRSRVRTSARIQVFCRKYNISIGFDGTRKNPRNIPQRNISMFIYNNHFRLIWESNGIRFNQAKEEKKSNFKLVDNVISDRQFKSFIKYEDRPKEVQSPLTNNIAYNLETYMKYRAFPFCGCSYKLRKTFGKYNRDITENEYQKCSNDCVVFDGSVCNNDMLDHVLSFRGQTKKFKNKIVEYILYMIVHNGSGFDSCVVLNNLPQWRCVVNLIKNGAGNISPKIFNGYVDEKKKIP